MSTLMERAALIRLVILDVDGVLTDGRLYLGDDGQEYKAFFAQDGLGIRLLQASGVIVAIITGKTSTTVIHRMNTLGIKYVFQGQLDKRIAFQQLCTQLQLQPLQVAYVGDDVNDVPVMQQVGLAIAVANAHYLAVQYAHWRTQASGGQGAVREVCELIMQAQGTLTTQLKQYGILL